MSEMQFRVDQDSDKGPYGTKKQRREYGNEFESGV